MKRIIYQVAVGLILNLLVHQGLFAQPKQLDTYNPVWNTQSKNSGESMPCGGGDIGTNVWVENGDLLVYLSRPGTFDENNTMLKLGRLRVKLFPNPFTNGNFRQELKLKDGYIEIQTKDGEQEVKLELWADVYQPGFHIDIEAKKPVSLKASYETWRFEDRQTKGKENNANSYKWAPRGPVFTKKDAVGFVDNKVIFYHQNKGETAFDITVKQQHMEQLKDSLYNPLQNLIFGGLLDGPNMHAADVITGKYMDTPFKAWAIESNKPSVKQRLDLSFYTAQHSEIKDWRDSLSIIHKENIADLGHSRMVSRRWWHDFWNRSYIFLNEEKPDSSSVIWQVGRNYQLFRYMLGCNAYGKWPTKFNGGLFTYDPSHTDSTMKFTPDFRNWGGGTHTAQNQRLVYWPMLKSGDFDMMKSQFDFYLQLQKNAELRAKRYWDHAGACFPEQIENFGFPNPAEYNWNRPADFDKGVEYNKWLEYEWDTVLEFCKMMLDVRAYNGTDIKRYVPFVESCLTFFNEHYQYETLERWGRQYSEDGKLIIYPGSAAETYKLANNPNSTISGLKSVLTNLIALPDNLLDSAKKSHWKGMLSRLPELSFRNIDGYTMIAPAKTWERINNTEAPQLYPVYPWGEYGLGRPGLDVARNTFFHDPDVLRFRSHVGWKQDVIFAARLGLREEASGLTFLKLKDSGRRFPAFWGPGFDWTPDHNWGGSGMIGLQEMVMQCVDDKIYILPAMPLDWNVHFKLHAPKNTTVEVVYNMGKLEKVNVSPASRRSDIVMLLNPESKPKSSEK